MASGFPNLTLFNSSFRCPPKLLCVYEEALRHVRGPGLPEDTELYWSRDARHPV